MENEEENRSTYQFSDRGKSVTAQNNGKITRVAGSSSDFQRNRKSLHQG